MSNIPAPKSNIRTKTQIASKIPTSGRDSGTHSRSSSVSNLTTASDIHSEIGDATSESNEDFKIEDRVWVNGTKPGYVKFIGKTQFAPGVWAGVLLDEPVGKNDGSVAGVKYFTCEPMRGIFARPGKLTRTAREESTSTIGNLSSIGTMTPKSSGLVPSSRASTCSVSSVSPKTSKLKIGDRITVSSLSGLKTGTLRFIGETDFAKGEWAGIELDEPSGKNDGSVAGKRYFSCEIKYGLFAPLHKVCKPGMTTPGSARGTPLMRSSSKDSLSSSVSACSRASRVKLGVTSLTASAQKTKTPGAGITTTTKALQEALKEKEQHIEQLLKERDFDRTEFARLTSQLEEIDAKYAELEKKQKLTLSEKKNFEDQLSIIQRKFEDIQFQLEEEKIAKSDIEAQFRQRNHLLKRVEEFLSKSEKFTNIEDLLSRQTNQSEIGDVNVISNDTNELQTKIAEMEATIKRLNSEKQEVYNNLTEVRKTSSETSSENETFITKLKNTIQEKDEMIKNLKNELNNNIEKVAKLIEDNKHLSDQIILKEEKAKGHADDVIKELGEKINLLEDEIKNKSSLLTAYLSSIEEKENLISSLQQNFDSHVAALLQLQTEKKELNESLRQKDLELNSKVAKIKTLEEQIDALNVHNETSIAETEKKMLDLVREIECLTNSNQEKEDCLLKVQNELKSSQSYIDSLNENIKQLSEKVQLSEDSLTHSKENSAKMIDQLQTELNKVNEEKSEFQKKVSELITEKEKLTNSNQEKDDLVLKIQSELSSSQITIQTLEENISQLNESLLQADAKLTESIKELTEKNNKLQTDLQKANLQKSDYEQKVCDLSKETEHLRNCMQEKEKQLLKIQKELISSQNTIDTLNQTIQHLSEKIQEADLNLSGATEDANEKIKELHNELSQIKKEKSDFEKELSDAKNEIENLSNLSTEREKCVKGKEEIIKSLEEKCKIQESEIFSLSAENANLLENTAKFSAQIEGEQKMFNDKFSDSVKEFDNKLKEKDQIIHDTYNELEKYKKLMEDKTKEVSEKDKEINLLKGFVNDKDAQFDELNKMMEASQAQLILLKQENEKNVSLLKSKESDISEFKMNLEKHLTVKEQTFKEETSRLESLIQAKDEEIKSKQSELSNLIQMLEIKKTEVETLQKELEASKNDQQNVCDESSAVCEKMNYELADLKEKYEKLLKEKEKIVKEELQTRDAKKNLELLRDSLLQEKSAQEEIVKDREAKLEALQTEVNRMKIEFSQHKQELQQKIDVSQMEIEAGIELKNQFEIQHGVIEELQKELNDADEKYKKLETELKVITSDRDKLQTQADELQKFNKEKTEQFSKMEEKYQTLEEMHENTKNLMSQKEKEVSVLKEQLQKMPSDKVPFESMALSLKSLENENNTLKNKITMLELEKEENKSVPLTKTTKQELSAEDEQEMESLLSQVDFLNSIIVDMKQKNEELTRKLEAQASCWEEASDVNLNESKKVIAPRLFCDICDMFDMHETCDCPKQESFQEEEVPHLRRAGTREIEERPYCNNCEVFGHWTLDCQEPDTF